MNIHSVKKLIQDSLSEFRIRHTSLLTYDANERSISHKLAEILQGLVGDQWDVDCEYNRDRHDSKRVQLPVAGTHSDETKSRTVYPDIIIHKRGTGDNFIVIEIKKSSNVESDDHDKNKLKSYRDELGYQYSVFIRLSLIDYNDDYIDIVPNCTTS